MEPIDSTNNNTTEPINVIIDSHEEKLITALESDSLKKECGHLFFDVATLEVGDILYKKGQNNLCLIERKTLEDYASSITDKRSHNQSIRIQQLRKEYPKMIVIYLIEGGHIGKDFKFRNGIMRDSLYTSFINRVLKDQFTIYRTYDIYDTALVVTKIYDRLNKMIDICQGSETVDCERLDYLKTIKLAKKENMTPRNCYTCQLSQIPGVSIEVADNIAQIYPSMHKLISHYEQLQTTSEKEKLLSEIIIPIANNKSKRLGNVISKRIYEYLCDPQPINSLTSEPPIEPIKIKIKLKK